jgi:hypothetical protein
MKPFFTVMLIAMVAVTTWASLDSSVIEGTHYLLSNRWGIATFGDTYFGFLTIYLWMAYKEPAPLKRILWFIAVLSLGTIAISVFMLHELYLNRGKSFESFLLRKQHA